MANLPETPQWEEGIYQIEVSDPVLGGPDGISNRQAKQLASRTSYLKQKVEKDGTDLAAHIAAADPHTQYAQKASPTFTGTPTAPTQAKTDNSTKLATTAHVKSVVADYAPLSSPALTGKPTAPTAAQTANDTQLANTAFVKAAIAALVASSPEALDTLNELAAALGNDPNFATTMTNALAGKQPLDNTLTALSGKSVAALLEYLGLGEAAKLAAATGSLSASGWLKIPIFGGASVILQWGKVALTATLNSGAAVKGYDGVTVFNYPISFPNAALIVNATPMDSGETLVETATANGTSKTAATVRVGGVAIKSDPAATADLQGFVFAIGY
ncbi:TPA: phage tail protein [Citrobacter farmeri]